MEQIEITTHDLFELHAEINAAKGIVLAVCMMRSDDAALYEKGFPHFEKLVQSINDKMKKYDIKS